MKQDMIVILDLGSTENTVIARDIRSLGVYSEIHPHDITTEELKALDNVKGIILSGGENRIVDGEPVVIRPELYDLGYPMISIDYPESQCEKKYDKLPDAETLKKFVFVERFPELSLFFKAYSLLDSEMICIFPYLCPYAESAREIREIFS